MRYPFLMSGLLELLYWFDEALQTSLAVAGYQSVTRTESMLLVNVAGGEHRAARLAKKLGVSRQAISQLLADMESRGIVTTTQDPHDRRARIVNYSNGAQELRHAAQDILRQVEAILAFRIGQDEFAGLVTGINTEWGETPIVTPKPAEPSRLTAPKAATPGARAGREPSAKSKSR